MADKSVLEKYYDDEAKKRRAPTSKEMEQDAIEPDTTLEGLLIGPGRAAAGAIAKGVNRFVNKSAPKVTAPKIGSQVRDDSDLETWVGRARAMDPDQPLPLISAEKRARKEILRNKANISNALENATVKGLRRGYGELAGMAANRYSNNKNPSDNSYKSGGKVSSASSRADGCCVKGKTKGRYL